MDYFYVSVEPINIRSDSGSVAMIVCEVNYDPS
jgi:hypothetical protein